MDIIFKCPHCDQELEVDASGAGTELACPSCSKQITVPEPEPGNILNISAAAAAAAAAAGAPAPPREEKHFVVPQRAVPSEALIQKPKRILEVAAKEGDKTIKVKTFRRTDCQEVGHDKFDEVVSDFLEKVGQTNIVGVHPITYSHIDLATRNVMNEYGVIIIYRG